MLDAGPLFLRRGSIARDPERGLRIAGIEQLAGQQPPLVPPFVGVVYRCRRRRRGEHCLRRLIDLVTAAQPLRERKQISGVALRLGGHRVEQRFCLGRLVDHRLMRLDDRDLRGTKPLRRAQSGPGFLGIEPAIHPRLVIAA
jgi:hypothetical protein